MSDKEESNKLTFDDLPNENEENIQVQSFEIIQSSDSALIDTQIATAKKYPRNINRAIKNAIYTATMDIDTAKSCGYCVPRGGKDIRGESVHLARIIINYYQNMRIETHNVFTNDDKIVIGEAICLDLENNVGVKVQASRSIIYSEKGDKKGKRYSEDLINTTRQAAQAIALRNAVFNVIPKPVIAAVYKATREKITGDLSDSVKLNNERIKWINHYKSTYNVTETQILKMLKVASIDYILSDEILKMIEINQAIKDRDTTIDEVFNIEKPAQDIGELPKKETPNK